MKVYCPNCGQVNETGPSARVMCTACTAVFDAPPEPGAPAPAPPSPPPAAEAPGASWSQPQPPPSWQPPPSPNYGTPTSIAATGQVTNTLAIVSLVAGIVCCIPVVSPLTAIITGAIAISQINANPATQKGKGLAIAGIILGGLTVIFNIISLIANVAQATS